MEVPTDVEEQQVKHPFTLFGEPVIKTQCQRNAWICGISGGVFSGLIAFLFTSSPRKSTYIAVGSYMVITFSMGCYCMYDEYSMRKQARLIKKTIHEINAARKATESTAKGENV